MLRAILKSNEYPTETAESVAAALRLILPSTANVQVVDDDYVTAEVDDMDEDLFTDLVTPDSDDWYLDDVSC
jgi:hypothetical protein